MQIKQVNLEKDVKLKKAITYIRKREDFSMIYQEDDHCGLSNNLRENGI